MKVRAKSGKENFVENKRPQDKKKKYNRKTYTQANMQFKTVRNPKSPAR